MRAAVALSLALALLLAPATGDAAPAPPYAFTLDARDITLTAATLRATVNPNGSAASFHFEYGTSTSYDHQTAEQDAGSGSGDLTVETAINGLADTTIFHFRIVVSGPGGVARGFDQTFRTREPPRAPTINTAGADEVAPTSVTMTGSLDPHDAPTTFHFDYGLTASYGSRTPDVAVAGYGSRVVRQPVTGLNVAATYHYRLVAVNASGTSIGRDQTVATRRDPTSITVHTDSDAYPVWGDVVTLVGRVRGRGIGGIPLAVTRRTSRSRARRARSRA